MIYSVVVNLEAEHDAEIPANLGYHALALFLGLLKQVDEQLAYRLHSMDGLKPFTVSPLQGKFTHRNSSISVPGGAVCWLRFTALEEVIFARLMDGFIKGTLHLRLEQADFNVVDVITHPQGSPWAGFASFAEIIENASVGRNISLQFTSPTVFRSGGKRNVTFSTPALVFGSLLNKWNSFSDVGMPDEVMEMIESGMLVSRYKLETAMLEFDHYQELGFTGSCHYIIDNGADLEMVKRLNALADFAFFSGIGAKTTMGMGQARRIDHVRSISY